VQTVIKIAVFAVCVGLGWVIQSTLNTESTPEPSSDDPLLVSKRVLASPPASLTESSSPGKVTVTRDSSLPEPVDFDVDIHTADYDQLGKMLKATTDPVQRRFIFEQMIAQLTPENAKSMRVYFADMDQNSTLFKDFHYAWGRVGGQEAVLHGAESKELDLHVTVAGWANSNPGAAISWLAGLNEQTRPTRSWAMHGLIAGLIDNDPAKAAQFVQGMYRAEDAQATRMTRRITNELSGRYGSEYAMKWTASLPAGPMQNNAASYLANTIGRSNVEQAVAFAQSLPESSQGAALTAAYRRWGAGQGGGDPVAASETLVAMEPSPQRDAAIQGFSRGISRKDAVSALYWARDISDPRSREATTRQAAEQIKRKDVPKVIKWLKKADMPQATFNEIAKNLKKYGYDVVREN
jgi:hypothetical protein